MIGLLVHAFNAVTHGPLHYRVLEREKTKYLRFNNLDFDAMMPISEPCKLEIRWWLDNIEKVNGKLIRPNPIDEWLQTDASLKGWGASSKNISIGDRWTVEESSHHINYLELLAIFLGLKSFYKNDKNKHIGIKSDSSTAVAYINNMGGITSDKLDDLAICIWSWCQERNFYITAIHVPGVENVTADYKSRIFNDSNEWMLKKDIFTRICKQTVVPSVDLFASRLNHQIQNYVSWSFDPGASAVDAFTISWSNMIPYIFPPFSLIPRVLSKLRSDVVEKAIIVVPFWPTQSWFSLLISVMISLPIRLPRHKDLLMLPSTRECHPLNRKTDFVALILSGNHSLIEDFHQKLPQLLFQAGEKEQGNNMICVLENGYFGVVQGMQIPFLRLRN